MFLKKGMLVKARENLTITRNNKNTNDFLPSGNICLIVDVLEDKNRIIFNVLCDAFKGKYGLETIVIPFKRSKMNETVMKYFAIV